MKKIKYLLNITLALMLLIVVACEEEQITSFEDYSAVNFVTKSVEYSFLGNVEGEFIQEANVRIMGNAKDYDRLFKVEVINDSLTTASTNQFEIIDGIVYSGEFTGALRVKVLNSAALDSTKVSIHLKIVDTEDFNKGNLETNELVITWSNKIVVPVWSYFKYFFSSTSSTSCYRAIVEATGYTKFTSTEYGAVGGDGAIAIGTAFGNYVKQWNLDHPNNHLKHDDGTKAGEDIIPLYYTKSLYD